MLFRPTMPTNSYQLSHVLQQMLSRDQDFRFMALNDLMAEVARNCNIFSQDESSEMKVLDQVLSLVEDPISKVKDQAVQCLRQLIKIIRETNVIIIIDKLIEISGRHEDESRNVANLALKTVVSELPLQGKLTDTACVKIFRVFLEHLQNPTTHQETMLETLSTISVLVTRFPQQAARAQLDPVGVIIPLLEHSQPGLRKRAIFALAHCLWIVSGEVFTGLLKINIIPALSSGAQLDQQCTIIQLLGSIARYSPLSLRLVLGDVMPGVLKAARRDDTEVREEALRTLERFVLGFPLEITQYLPQTLAIAAEMVKYDPNYIVDTDDSDDAGGYDDDDDAGDDYPDDDDTSYKVRQSAIKVIATIVNTRPELLSSIYQSVSPVLISQFGDRHKTVKLELWSTYGILIKQTGVYKVAQQTRGREDTSRNREDRMDVEDTPPGLLKAQVPQISKALLKQLRPNSPSKTLLAGFTLLRSLLVVLPGSLSMSAENITAIVSSVLSRTSNPKTSKLKIEVLAFLGSFFSSHPPATLQVVFPRLTSQLLAATSQSHPSVTAESLCACSALLTALKPVESGEWVDMLYDEAVALLRNNDTTTQVRRRAEEIVADLWLCASAVVSGKGGAEWDALMHSGPTEGAVQVITKIAANVDMEDADDVWLTNCTNWVVGLLRKHGRAGKDHIFPCLEVLLRRYQNGIPNHLPGELVPQLQAFLSLTDLVLLTRTLIILSVLLAGAPEETFPLVERSVMSMAYKISYSPLLTGALLEAMTDFFCAAVAADHEISADVVHRLVLELKRSDDANTSPANVGKCISAIVKRNPVIAADIISGFAIAIKPGANSKEIHVVLSLMALGEIGRTTDMQLEREVFSSALTFFSADAEPVRTAAIFAAGNIAVGNVQYFFPLLIGQVQNSSAKRLLSLYAIKEALSRCGRNDMEMVASSLWTPLFEVSDTEDEITRNAAVACLGQLMTPNPSQHLSKLQGRLRDPSASVRATAVDVIRYTFGYNAQLHDKFLSPLIGQFLALVYDKDLTVRRQALSTVNTAAQKKTHLIREHLPTLMPLLYWETLLKRDWVRHVDGGYSKHHVGDQFEARKSTYETLYTILDKCVGQIDLQEFLNYVLLGLRDKADDIKFLCHKMLYHLAEVAPTAVAQRLDEVAPELKGGITTSFKLDTMKDLEQATKMNRSILRAVEALSKISGGADQMVFEEFVAELSQKRNIPL